MLAGLAQDCGPWWAVVPHVVPARALLPLSSGRVAEQLLAAPCWPRSRANVHWRPPRQTTDRHSQSVGRKTRSEALGPSARDAPRSCKKRSTHSRRAYILHPVCNCVCSLCSSCIYKVQRQSWKGTRSSSNPAARAFARPPSSEPPSCSLCVFLPNCLSVCARARRPTPLPLRPKPPAQAAAPRRTASTTAAVIVATLPSSALALKAPAAPLDHAAPRPSAMPAAAEASMVM